MINPGNDYFLIHQDGVARGTYFWPAEEDFVFLVGDEEVEVPRWDIFPDERAASEAHAARLLVRAEDLRRKAEDCEWQALKSEAGVA